MVPVPWTQAAGLKRKRGSAKERPGANRPSKINQQASARDNAIPHETTSTLPLDLSFLDSLELPAVKALATGFRPDAALSYNPHELEQAYPNQHFTQHWTQCQNRARGRQDLQDLIPCSWRNFPAHCGPSLPCSNPKCEDVSLCPSITGKCAEPLDCLGNICYDQHCTSDGQAAADAPCDQHCDTATRCASPCFSDECRVPVCDAACVPPVIATDHRHLPDHEKRPFDVLCHSQRCQIPGFGCIDPQCLAPGYTPAAHVHHPIDAYYGYGQTQDSASSNHVHADDAAQHFGGSDATHAGAGAVPTANMSFRVPEIQNNLQGALQPVQDVNHGPSPIGQPLAYSYDYINNDNAGPTTPALTPSVATTPRSPTSAPQDLYGLAITRPSTSTPKPHICLWSATSAGDPSQPCGMSFANAADLHAHVEHIHIDTLQRTSDNTETPGYYCRWASCLRNTHCIPQPNAYPPSNSTTTTTRPTQFAARPKLKRHLQTHTQHTPYTCPHCPAVMKTRDAMTKHARTHTGERPYICPVPGCTKIFATSTELRTHTVVHSGLKPHICTVCGEGFADSSNLSKHRKTHVSLGMYRCPQERGGCGCRMKRWDQMRRHWVGRGHCAELMGDEGAVRDYKEAMEREWKGLMVRGVGVKYEA